MNRLWFLGGVALVNWWALWLVGLLGFGFIGWFPQAAITLGCGMGIGSTFYDEMRLLVSQRSSGPPNDVLANPFIRYNAIGLREDLQAITRRGPARMALVSP